jgi:DNA-binding response OmpR family regulator
MAKILLVEDDRQLCTLIIDTLQGEGHVIDAVHKGPEGLERLRFYKYELVILDWELPGMSGPEICQEFRSKGGTSPVLMLTGKKEIEDKEVGLDAGADDYLTKPFHFKELTARIRALMRRPAPVLETVLKVGDITLNPVSRQVYRGDEQLNLQPKELALLEFFMRHPNQPFSSEAILDRVWSSESDAAPDTVRIQIMRLRHKIDSDGKESMIRTLHRVGYMMVPPGTD